MNVAKKHDAFRHPISLGARPQPRFAVQRRCEGTRIFTHLSGLHRIQIVLATLLAGRSLSTELDSHWQQVHVHHVFSDQSWISETYE